MLVILRADVGGTSAQRRLPRHPMWLFAACCSGPRWEEHRDLLHMEAIQGRRGPTTRAGSMGRSSPPLDARLRMRFGHGGFGHGRDHPLPPTSRGAASLN